MQRSFGGHGASASPSARFGPAPRRRVGMPGASYLRTALLMGGLTVLAVLTADLLGGASWAIGAFVVMTVMNLVSWFYSDRIVIAMHGAQPIDPTEEPRVHAVVREVAQRAGIPMPKLYEVDDPAPNAFATGRNPQHAAVVVTRGLLELLDDRELAAVVAHELSHVVNRDVLIATIAATLAGAISLIARLAGWGLMLGQGGRSNGDRGGTNPIAALLLIIVAPIIALILHLAVSRSREYGADASGATLVGDPEALVRALAKLQAAARQIPMRTADPATSHLYIVTPLSARSSLMALFSTHPPIERRIERLRAMERTWER